LTTSSDWPAPTRLPEPNQIIVGDVREVLTRHFPDSSIDLGVTSPPYFKLRNYTDNNPQEVGRETTPETFILSLLNIFDVLKKKLKDSGSLWVNIGDTYINGSPLCVPEEFCRMMVRTRGWALINKVIWYKLDSMPESSKRRFSQKYEMFYWFVKDKEKYYFDQEASNIPVKACTTERMNYNFNSKKADVSRVRGIVGDMSDKIDLYMQRGVNCGDVWAMPTNKEKVNHPAPYPTELIVRPIISCCPPGGVVFDPFMGSGTTGVATYQIGGDRIFYGSELNPENAKEARERIANEMKQMRLL
jgi:site-specific DNA-methyltransferase (adenine-specific)